MKKITLEDFIQKAKTVHGDKYNYSKVIYINAKTKVCIICPDHGEFYQIPDNHINGKNCPLCSHVKRIKTKTLTTKQFIEKAKVVHSDKYDYSKSIYISAKTKLTITCSKHGDFEQTPDSHLSGQGCPACANFIRGKNQTLTIEEFIEKANKVHNNIYSYSQIDYVTNQIKIKIKCRKHGIFEQLPSNHLSGNGCPQCKKSKGELRLIEIFDKNNISWKDEYRIPEVVNELYYDFYLPDHNLLIEFHGIQHYEYSSFFHRNDEDNFLKQKDRDDIVRHNARYFKYKYLEFNYRHLKELSKEQFEQLVLISIFSFKKKV